MKKNLLVLLLILGSLMLFANNGFDVSFSRPSFSEYQLDFELGDFRLDETMKNGEMYSKIEFGGGVTTKKAGWAELPYINATVQLENRNVTPMVTDFEYEEYDLNYPMLPSRGTIYRNQNPDLIPYLIDPNSITDEFYPENVAEVGEPFVIRSVRGTNVYVYPFQYNAARNVLRVYTSVTVSLVENNTSVINPLPVDSSRITRESHFMYSTLFINYDNSRFVNELDQYGSILVIYTARDENAIQPWIQWKKEMGYTVYEELVATGTNVQTLVETSYNNNNDILYVQIVGDWEDISGAVMGGDPADPNLGCVVGTDVYPDLVIGRFSASNETDVITQVNKSITYEQTPQTGASWYTTALGIASNQGPGDDNELDYEHINVIYDDKLSQLTYTSHETQFDPSASAAGVGTAVNNGVSIINYTGHGSTTSWGSSGFSNSHVNMLTNGEMLPFIISVACVNGNFNGGTCFAEAWLRKENGGAIGMLASTQNQSWNPPMMGQDYMNDLLIGGYDYSLHPGQNGTTTDVQKTTYGSMCFNGTILMAMEDGYQGAEEMAKWTVFGDATLQVRTDSPAALTLSNNAVLMGVDFTTIVSANGNPIEGAMVTLYQDGEVATGITDATGSVTLSHNLAAGDAKLTVTAFNGDTIYDDISVIPPGGAYVMFDSCVIDDSAANDNGMLDYAETADLDVTLINVGTDPATGVSATLSSSDQYVTITDDSQDFGDIASGGTVTEMGAFTIEIDPAVPDMHAIAFEMEATDGTETWISNFTLMAHAPILEMGPFTIDDTAAGNGDYFWDAGETVDILVDVLNNGSADAFNVLGELVSNDQYITINSSNSTVGDVLTGDTEVASFNVTSAANTPQAYVATFSLNISGDNGITGYGQFGAQIGGYLIEEYFDTFLPTDWYTEGGTNWIAGTGNNAGGTAPEAEFYWSPSTLATQRLVCPVINTTGNQSLDLEFKHMVDDFGGGYALKIQTTSDGNTWNDAWVINPNGDIGPEIVQTEITTSDVGSTTFQLAFVFDGDSWDINNWYVDDVILGGGGASGPAVNANISSIDFGEVEVGESVIEEFTLSNPGTEELTGTMTAPAGFSLAVDNFTIDAGDSQTFEVEFIPTEGMVYSGDLVINSNAINQPTLEIALEGTGIMVGNDPNLIPTKTELTGNYPNPFNPTTDIKFAIKDAGKVTIDIYNIKGAKVTTLVNEEMEPGFYTARWDGKDSNKKNVSSGVYFYKMRAGGRYTSTRKMIMLK
ncbi:MAG: choice-of-anchor D domain-containing protein [Candidatus Cloacimonetes bacterium]|nr:choice-of-anchor D domain-containing protein [Candidatus Cloacimonadota bacterium]MCF7813120.1 choice-of-anchor D domain-containing protein [Candidatus Cloacimonadota bacterium]MCF7867568.1 choice-of-anchor D domain-containing protein [Candidatus Cloacimonadota bacterium]MCF7883038.1 choice-of-anchor D domain-containing protein [Candidatus Cloacimonadota bacterium]